MSMQCQPPGGVCVGHFPRCKSYPPSVEIFQVPASARARDNVLEVKPAIMKLSRVHSYVPMSIERESAQISEYISRADRQFQASFFSARSAKLRVRKKNGPATDTFITHKLSFLVPRCVRFVTARYKTHYNVISCARSRLVYHRRRMNETPIKI